MSFVTHEVAQAATELVSDFQVSRGSFRSVGHLALQHDPDLAGHLMRSASRLSADGSDNPAVDFVLDLSEMLFAEGMICPDERADRIAAMVLGHSVREEFRPQFADPEYWASGSRRLSA